MYQGYFVELGMKNNNHTAIKIALVSGWLSFGVCWGVTLASWYTGLYDALSNRDVCQASSLVDMQLGIPNRYRTRTDTQMPDEIIHVIWAIFAFYATFGINNIIQVIDFTYNGWSATRKRYAFYELTYIILSLVSKTTLILWCTGSIFGGKLLWLQSKSSVDVYQNNEQLSLQRQT